MTLYSSLPMAAAREAEAETEAAYAALDVPSPWSRLEEVSRESLRPGGLTITRKALELCAFPPRARLIDMACGPGATLGLLGSLGFCAAGVDSDPAMIRRAALRGPVAQARMEETPFADHIADGIFCECALSLASDRARVLGEFHRILRPGGLLVLSDIVVNPPDPDEPPGPFDDFPTDPDDRPRLAAAPHPAAACACRATTLEENLALLRAASLTPIAVEDHRTALRALAAALVWAYGRSGLDELAGLGACGSGDERTGRLGYVLIISENGPDGEREAGRSD